jgi:membrane fusion protein, multidrug efflux system
MRPKPVSLALVLLPATLQACDPPRHVERTPIQVDVVTVSLGHAEPQYYVSGEVRARNESALAFQISGKVIERRVDVGDHVAAGAVLARLDAKQQLADVDVSTASVQSATAALRQAKLDYERERNLLAQNATSQVSYDGALERYRFAQSSLAGAESALSLAREALSYTELRASRAGTIIARQLEVGRVAPANALAFSLAEDGPRDAVFHVQEGIAQRLSGRHLELTSVDDPKVHSDGVVREIAPLVDAATSSVAIKVAIAQPTAALPLRAPVMGQLALPAEKTITLPAQAITSDHGQPAVWVVDRETGSVSLRRIDVYGYASQNIIVRAGLDAGEIVVTHGAGRLRPDQVVTFKRNDSV